MFSTRNLNEKLLYKLYYFWGFNVYKVHTLEDLRRDFLELQAYYPRWYYGWWGHHKHRCRNHRIHGILFFTSPHIICQTRSSDFRLSSYSTSWHKSMPVDTTLYSLDQTTFFFDNISPEISLNSNSNHLDSKFFF